MTEETQPLITIKIEGSRPHIGTSFIGQHIQELLVKEGYAVSFISSEIDKQEQLRRTEVLMNSPDLRDLLRQVPIVIQDHHLREDCTHRVTKICNPTST